MSTQERARQRGWYNEQNKAERGDTCNEKVIQRHRKTQKEDVERDNYAE